MDKERNSGSIRSNTTDRGSIKVNNMLGSSGPVAADFVDACVVQTVGRPDDDFQGLQLAVLEAMRAKTLVVVLDGQDGFPQAAGAPKIRAMEIIDELEPTQRGPYAGAIGYFDYSGGMDMCITIRTIVFRDSVAHIQAGAGIVADSVPEREYEETLSKARGLLKAIEITEQRAG